jgi:hypothetical protein
VEKLSLLAKLVPLAGFAETGVRETLLEGAGAAMRLVEGNEFEGIPPSDGLPSAEGAAPLGNVVAGEPSGTAGGG